MTIYFIPVLPIGPIEQFLACSTCRTNSPIEALQHDERSFRAAQDLQFRLAVFQAATMVAIIDEQISEQQIAALLELGAQLVPGAIDREQLGALCSSIRLNRVTPKNYISTVSRPWSTAQRRTALQAIFVAASAGGKLEDAKLNLLAWLREQFGMSQTEYEDAIEDAVNAGVEIR